PALLETGLLAAEREGRRVVVADFDYSDSSGEIADQRAEHAVRVKAFAALLRNRLADEGKYKVLHFDCTKATCSAGNVGTDDLIAAARNVDAQLLIYGGIHKMSTLITWGSVQIVDVRQRQLILNRLFSFRGDTDEAFRRASKFISETLQDVAPKS
ncbi:MAG: DUF2380 domain-containing protein, partial [Pseudolabrys sp.]